MVLPSGTALVVPAGAAASGRATAGTTRAVPDGSTTHSSADRIVVNSYNIMGGELRNGVNGFLTSYATDSVRFSQQILDKEHAGTPNVLKKRQI